MLHVVSAWCLFHSVQLQSVEIRDLERSLWIFFSIDSFESLSRFINLCQHGEAQEKAWAGKVRTSINSVFVTLWWKCFGGVVLNGSERVKQKSKTSSSYICLFLSWSELWANYLTNLCTGVQERKREKRRKKRKVQDLWSCSLNFSRLLLSLSLGRETSEGTGR